MNKSVGELVAKIVLCVLLSGVILFLGFFASLIVSLAGGALFYAPLVLVVAAVLVVSLAFLMFLPKRHRRKLYFSLLAVVILGGLTTAGYEIRQAYHQRIPVVSDQEVDMWPYRPFADTGKLAVLPEPSQLTLTEDLPRLDGATALYPLYAAFAQAVYPRQEYDLYDSEVMVNTTPVAYKNLIEGRADIIFAAAPSEGQIAAARKQGKELKLTPIGREAFVFFVNASNPVTGLTTEQIRGIYSGEITRWSEVGGRNERIRAFQRPEDSGSQTMLIRVMDGRELATPPKENVASGMGGIISRTADYRNYKNALGYSFLYYATEMVNNGNIRLLAIDGVKPERATIASGEYPFAAEFYAVTAGSDNPNVERLIEWIQSSQGQYLVEQTGYTPLVP
ncbi:PstS family phosphate ABC transporter substrate-binding protein [Paenibacillus barengoltzii]|uniref:Phosphate transport system substrate-binding protein n=1 Tax=Paenibacillus barengoltzii J12 TaxID=935846 RepID=A0ABY1LYH9_9BACL|nr:substrate-binding domain-containing protein [Paenibacillus barengoltzii]MEC2345298.1 substrate-binding domain-containing protein [Paenibacillus barengoltzii]SMF34243.1 phosphate transport system substrate-binding protein [Paenibacillus barengoltzii J12]